MKRQADRLPGGEVPLFSNLISAIWARSHSSAETSELSSVHVEEVFLESPDQLVFVMSQCARLTDGG